MLKTSPCYLFMSLLRTGSLSVSKHFPWVSFPDSKATSMRSSVPHESRIFLERVAFSLGWIVLIQTDQKRDLIFFCSAVLASFRTFYSQHKWKTTSVYLPLWKLLANANAFADRMHGLLYSLVCVLLQVQPHSWPQKGREWYLTAPTVTSGTRRMKGKLTLIEPQMVSVTCWPLVSFWWVIRMNFLRGSVGLE